MSRSAGLIRRYPPVLLSLTRARLIGGHDIIVVVAEWIILEGSLVVTRLRLDDVVERIILLA